MTPERIYESLTTGSMQAQSSGLTDAQKKALAEFMASRPIGSARQGDGKACRISAPVIRQWPTRHKVADGTVGAMGFRTHDSKRQLPPD